MVAGLKGAALAKGSAEVFYPGEIEARNERRPRSAGLNLPPDIPSDLAKLADEMGLPHLAA